VKKIVILLALIIFLKPIFPVIEYAIHYDYISKVLCENKDKPQMHCNGKCYLMKEMAKTAEQEKPISSDKKVTLQEQETLFFQAIKTFTIKQVCLDDTTPISDYYSNLYFHLQSHPVFHPPTLV
jgi:hypothetical protein